LNPHKKTTARGGEKLVKEKGGTLFYGRGKGGTPGREVSHTKHEIDYRKRREEKNRVL